MSIDLEKLTPAPWYGDESYLVCGTDRNGDELAKFGGATHDRNTNAAFCALARNAFDVMMRRGWSVHCYNGKFAAMMPSKVPTGKYLVCGERSVMADAELESGYRADPFTALVEAERWYKENVEAAHAGEKAQA